MAREARDDQHLRQDRCGDWECQYGFDALLPTPSSARRNRLRPWVRAGTGWQGRNQAIAASRLGAKVSFIGCVGDDDYGRALHSGFEAADVNISHLHPRSKPLIRRAPGIR